MAGKIILYSQSATVRAGLLELVPDAVAAATPAQALAMPGVLLVADLALNEAAEWLATASMPALALGGPGLGKPLSLARLRRHIAQRLAERRHSFSVGPFTCDALARTLLDSKGRNVAHLTEKEVRLLQLLSEKQSASRAEILAAVWGYRDDLDTHTLETHIYTLRQKLGDDAARPAILLTTDGGYALASS